MKEVFEYGDKVYNLRTREEVIFIGMLTKSKDVAIVEQDVLHINARGEGISVTTEPKLIHITNISKTLPLEAIDTNKHLCKDVKEATKGSKGHGC